MALLEFIIIKLKCSQVISLLEGSILKQLSSLQLLMKQNVKLQKQSHQQEIYTNILEELAKMKQRRLYKVDSRFTHTGKELLNRHGGGDLGSNPSSSIPLINTKAARKLDWQNKKKLQEGIDVAFGKEKKKLQQKINLKKLGKKASRSV